jgi:Flp pilus assembly protein TadB
MNLAVAVFLDLVNVLLAGGTGIETAVLTAASAGDGWSFDYIRMTLARAQSSRENYWDALDRAGIELDVQSLRDVAQSVRIAGEHGGRVRQSLASRADVLRKNNLAHIEHDAQRRTERMGIPMVIMFMGFVVFIGYPAFVSTLIAL